MPDHLKAIIELTYETRDAGTRGYLRDYGKVIAVSVLYGVAAWLTPGGSAAAMFFGGMAIGFMLNEVSERRAQRRLRLIHEVLIHLMHRTQTERTDRACKSVE